MGVPSSGASRGSNGGGSYSGGSRRGNGISPMEMEVLQPMQVRESRNNLQSRKKSCGELLDQAWMLLKMYMEVYPRISAALILLAVFVILTLLVENSFVIRHSSRIGRNRLTHDYSKIDRHYNFQAARMDHWCLFGGDESCHCEDFTEPSSREDVHGWLAAHEANKQRAATPPTLSEDYDVVFLGDETVELWNGVLYNQATEHGEGAKINALWKELFGGTQSSGEGLALGIAEDSTSNLLWRLNHGELPDTLQAKVWWLLIGTNDLARGQCSEEATVLGILRAAEEIAFHHKLAVVVIQGILPRSPHGGDGSLEAKESSTGFFGMHHSHKADPREYLWPSIARINDQLQKFCEQHDRFVYYDATKLFVGSVGNEHFRQSSKQIVAELMPDYQHLSYDGYKIMGQSIKKELERIILDEDQANDIERKVRVAEVK